MDRPEKRTAEVSGSVSETEPNSSARESPPPAYNPELYKAYDIILESRSVKCFIIENECCLCFPQILNTVLVEYSVEMVNLACFLLHVPLLECTDHQLGHLKAAGVIAPEETNCKLISMTHSRRLCDFLLETGPLDSSKPLGSGLNVYHQCFGGCRGFYMAGADAGARSRCIRCSVCHRLLSGPQFICHSHCPRWEKDDNDVDPLNCGDYIRVSGVAREKDILFRSRDERYRSRSTAVRRSPDKLQASHNYEGNKSTALSSASSSFPSPSTDVPGIPTSKPSSTTDRPRTPTSSLNPITATPRTSVLPSPSTATLGILNSKPRSTAGVRRVPTTFANPATATPKTRTALSSLSTAKSCPSTDTSGIPTFKHSSTADVPRTPTTYLNPTTATPRTPTALSSLFAAKSSPSTDAPGIPAFKQSSMAGVPRTPTTSLNSITATLKTPTDFSTLVTELKLLGVVLSASNAARPNSTTAVLRILGAEPSLTAVMPNLYTTSENIANISSRNIECDYSGGTSLKRSAPQRTDKRTKISDITGENESYFSRTFPQVGGNPLRKEFEESSTDSAESFLYN